MYLQLSLLRLFRLLQAFLLMIKHFPGLLFSLLQLIFSIAFLLSCPTRLIKYKVLLIRLLINSLYLQVRIFPKLRVQTWCGEHGYSAMHTTVPIIAEFLFLFSEKKLLPQTIEGYRSALSIKLDADLELGSYKELRRHIQRFYKSRPNASHHLPFWDLT